MYFTTPNFVSFFSYRQLLFTSQNVDVALECVWIVSAYYNSTCFTWNFLSWFFCFVSSRFLYIVASKVIFLALILWKYFHVLLLLFCFSSLLTITSVATNWQGKNSWYIALTNQQENNAELSHWEMKVKEMHPQMTMEHKRKFLFT